MYNLEINLTDSVIQKKFNGCTILNSLTFYKSYI